MKEAVFSLLFCCLSLYIFAQEINFGKSFSPNETAVYNFEDRHTNSVIASFFHFPPRRARIRDFYLDHYSYHYINNTAVDCEVLEVNGQIFPLKKRWIKGNNERELQIEERGEKGWAPLWLHDTPDMYFYSHKNKKYFVGDATPAGSNGYFMHYLLFDITNSSKIRFMTFGGLSFLAEKSRDRAEDMLVLYPDLNGKPCIIITKFGSDFETNVPKEGLLCSRLFSIEEYGLAEVLDNKGKNVEFIFDRDEWEYNRLEIKSVNIPKDIPLSELQFRPVEKYRFQEAATEEEIQTMLAKWKTGKPIILKEYDAEKETPAEPAPQHIPYKPNYTPPTKFYEYGAQETQDISNKQIPFPALAVFTLTLAAGFSAVIVITAIVRKRD